METNNKIIAEFMGATLTKDLQIMYPVYEGDSSYVKDLKYHLDWNWLMEVVEKCLVGEAEYNEDEAKKAIHEIYESLCNINITSVYNACVKFIKWYNEQNKK